MDIKFEKAKKEDARSLIEVQNICFKEDFDKYGECPAYEEKLEVMINAIESIQVYKIVSNNAIIGDIIVRKIEERKYYLRVLCVHKDYQNLGIGRKAIEFIELENPDAIEWTLITPEKSIRNRYLYEKVGYRNIGEVVHSDCLTLIQYKKEIVQ